MYCIVIWYDALSLPSFLFRLSHAIKLNDDLGNMKRQHNFFTIQVINIKHKRINKDCLENA